MINFECAKIYCNEDISRIENYEKAVNDSTQTWDCHHRRENISSRKDLIIKNEYFNRPASELIFLTKSEHSILHMKGKIFTEEHKQKLSDALKGHKNMLGKRHTEETRRKMSESHKNMSEETKLKMSLYRKLGRWFNNGIKNVFVKECPAGFVKGRLKKVKQS